MGAKTNKLKTKDLIIAGAFAALYVVVLMVVVSVLGMVPILYIMAPFFMAIILGPIYMMYVTKIPKTGAIFILSAIIGLAMSMGGVWVALIWSLIIGLIAEIIARAGKYKSKRMYKLSYIVFASTSMAPFWTILVAKDTFINQCLSYYGADYAQAVDRLTPGWMILVFIAIAMIGGIIGGLLGARLLNKHFKKAGVV